MTLHKAELNDELPLGACASNLRGVLGEAQSVKGSDTSDTSMSVGETAQTLRARSSRREEEKSKMYRQSDGSKVILGPNRRYPLAGCLHLDAGDSTPSYATE